MAETVTKKNIFVVCSTVRDRREMDKELFKQNYNIYFQDYDDSILDRIICGCMENPPESFSPSKTLNELLDFCRQHSVDGVVSSDDYPGVIFASIIANKLKLPGPSPETILTCQHKYYSRMMQQKYIPNDTPNFRVIDPTKFDIRDFNMPFPVFIKPVKSYFSIFANKVNNAAQLEEVVHSSLPSELFLQQFNWLVENYTTFELNANYLLAEELLQGQQVTLEGFVYQGKAEIIGIVDSIMYPGTFSFERFDYPSALPKSIQEKMAQLAKQYIEGIKFNNSLFNIEMMYNPETGKMYFIEVNPRICNQFADLYEKVDGINSYQILIDLAVGNKPQLLRQQGKYKIASSCVLRRFTDGKAIKIPSPEQLRNFYQQFPDGRVEIHIEEEQYLSSILQDGKSYRYGLIHLGAMSQNELLAKFEQSKQLLPFEFEGTKE